MLALARFTSFLITFLLGTGLSILSIIMIAFLLWNESYILLNHLTGLEILPGKLNYQSGIYISALIIVFIFSRNLFLFVFSFQKRSLRKLITPGKLIKTSKNDDLYKSLREVCKKMNTRTPSLYICSSNDGIIAFAHQYPFRNAIVIGDNLINAIGKSSEEMKWVLAHENSHIKHNDSLSGAMALLSQNSYINSYNIRIKIFNIANGFFNYIRVARAIRFIIMMPFYMVAKITDVIYKSSFFMFQLTDRHIGRKMEYRADKEATIAYDAEPGINLLKAIRGKSIEPSFNVFSTHPTTQKRIDNILKYKH